MLLLRTAEQVMIFGTQRLKGCKVQFIVHRSKIYIDKIGLWKWESSEYLWWECLYWAKASCLNFSSLFSSHLRKKKKEIKIENKSLVEMKKNKTFNRNKNTTRAWPIYTKRLVIHLSSVHFRCLLRWIPPLSYSSACA